MKGTVPGKSQASAHALLSTALCDSNRYQPHFPDGSKGGSEVFPDRPSSHNFYKVGGNPGQSVKTGFGTNP